MPANEIGDMLAGMTSAARLFAVLMTMHFLRLAPASADSRCGFGVIASGQAARPEVVSVVREPGSRRVRLNCRLDGGDPDYTLFLKSGVNVVLMLSNQDPANARTDLGSPREWPIVGFPYSDSFPVVLASFPSEGPDAVLDPADPRHASATERITPLEESTFPGSACWIRAGRPLAAKRPSRHSGNSSGHDKYPALSGAGRTAGGVIWQSRILVQKA